MASYKDLIDQVIKSRVGTFADTHGEKGRFEAYYRKHGLKYPSTRFYMYTGGTAEAAERALRQVAAESPRVWARCVAASMEYVRAIMIDTIMHGPDSPNVSEATKVWRETVDGITPSRNERLIATGELLSAVADTPMIISGDIMKGGEFTASMDLPPQATYQEYGGTALVTPKMRAFFFWLAGQSDGRIFPLSKEKEVIRHPATRFIYNSFTTAYPVVIELFQSQIAYMGAKFGKLSRAYTAPEFKSVTAAQMGIPGLAGAVPEMHWPVPKRILPGLKGGQLEIDAFFQAQGVALEFMGRKWHLNQAQYEADLLRHVRITAHGRELGVNKIVYATLSNNMIKLHSIAGYMGHMEGLGMVTPPQFTYLRG